MPLKGTVIVRVFVVEIFIAEVKKKLITKP